MTGLYPDDPQLPSGEHKVGLGADGKFTSGDPATGELPSRLPASHLNLLTDLLQRAIEDLGEVTANNTDQAQLSDAILKAITDRTQAIYSKTRDPTPSDDSTQGYKIGDRWINSITSETLILIDSTVGAAKWVDTSLTVDEIIPLIEVKLDKAGGIMTGNLAMSNNKITGLANGTAVGDAVNKGQLDAVAGSGYIRLGEGSTTFTNNRTANITIPSGATHMVCTIKAVPRSSNVWEGLLYSFDIPLSAIVNKIIFANGVPVNSEIFRNDALSIHKDSNTNISLQMVSIYTNNRSRVDVYWYFLS